MLPSIEWQALVSNHSWDNVHVHSEKENINLCFFIETFFVITPLNIPRTQQHFIHRVLIQFQPISYQTISLAIRENLHFPMGFVITISGLLFVIGLGHYYQIFVTNQSTIRTFMLKILIKVAFC